MERLYVLGHPVAHSKSPAMHNAAYRALGLDWRYDLMDCETEGQARDFIAQGQWLALNITMPYKPHALAAATSQTEAARMAGGANVLVRDARGGLFADNTDGLGCVSYLERCGVAFDGARVAVCGTGPTSQAIMQAAAAAGAREVMLLGRDEARAQRAAEPMRQLASEGGSAVVWAGAYETSKDALARADVIVDATPLGMASGDPAPFDVGVLDGSQVVFDVVYGHGETSLIAAARAAGCRALDGSGMLVAQAVATVHDIAQVTGLFSVPESLDLFAIMADAAGFALRQD